jgi:hypothetical protein
MRKLILLALGIGMLEMLKRRSEQQGLAPSAVLLGAVEKGLNWFRGPKKTGKTVQPAHSAEDE